MGNDCNADLSRRRRRRQRGRGAGSTRWWWRRRSPTSTTPASRPSTTSASYGSLHHAMLCSCAAVVQPSLASTLHSVVLSCFRLTRVPAACSFDLLHFQRTKCDLLLQRTIGLQQQYEAMPYFLFLYEIAVTNRGTASSLFSCEITVTNRGTASFIFLFEMRAGHGLL